MLKNRKSWWQTKLRSVEHLKPSTIHSSHFQNPAKKRLKVASWLVVTFCYWRYCLHYSILCCIDGQRFNKEHYSWYTLYYTTICALLYLFKNLTTFIFLLVNKVRHLYISMRHITADFLSSQSPVPWCFLLLFLVLSL